MCTRTNVQRSKESNLDIVSLRVVAILGLQVVFFALEMLFERLEEGRKKLLENHKSFLALTERKGTFQTNASVLLLHVSHDIVKVHVIIVELLGILVEPIVEDLEDDLVLMLGMLLMQNVEAVQVNDEHV